jgi:hypothetical protein
MKHVITTVAVLPSTVNGLAAADLKTVPFELYIPHPYFSIYAGPEHPTFTALGSEREWQRVWSVIEPRMGRTESRTRPYELPKIDFSRNTLIVVAIGSRPSGGFRVQVDSISESSSEIVVTATESTPASECVVTTSVTAPTVFALIARSEKRVRFDVRKTERGCSQ